MADLHALADAISDKSPRVGTTLEEARADVPQHVGGTIDAQKWNGKQPDDGPPTLVTV